MEMLMRVLLTGWFSFLHGEATAGDVLALDAVRRSLDQAGLRYDVAWSPVLRPGELRLENADPGRYSHLVFVCGPVHGQQVTGLHTQFAALRRIAVGVTVIDRADPAYLGFDTVLARDGDLGPPLRDLSAVVPVAPPPGTPPVPVAGIVLAAGQGEYGARRRHEAVAAQLTAWIGSKFCAPVPLETRLDVRDWRLCSTADAFQSLLGRLDLVVTTRLHGLALALRSGLPAIAVDPVDGGGKVTAQAAAWQWPAVLAAGQVAHRDRLDALWDWCLSADGRRAAATAARTVDQQPAALLASVLAELRRTAPSSPG
jgi:Polysaccharide pyruvyl transferase